MKKKLLLEWLLGDDSEDTLGDILRRCIIGLLLLTVILLVFVGFIRVAGWLDREITFLAVGGGSVLVGTVSGFLFGVPRVDKNRYNPSLPTNSSYYADNTNLEEISDWLTKIIVGLTLVKFRTILSWLNNAAEKMAQAFNNNNAPGYFHIGSNYFVFSYGVIVLYLLAGGLMAYLWTRINFAKILTHNRKTLMDIEVGEEQQKAALKVLNEWLTDTDTVPNSNFVTPTLINFKQTVEDVYKKHPIVTNNDLQKNRWGKSNINNRFQLSATVRKVSIGIFKLVLTLENLDVAQRQVSACAFFIHDTFPREIVYASFDNKGIAVLELHCYEAFTVGAYIDGGTELELDLNGVTGYPKDFYWKK